MSFTKAALVQPHSMTTTERDLLGLAGTDIGRLIWNATTTRLERWDGAAWHEVLVSTSSLDATKLTGVVSGALVDALPATKLTGQVTDAQVDTVSATKLTGQVSDGQIAGMDSSKLTGVVVDAQIRDLSSTKLIGDIDGGAF